MGQLYFRIKSDWQEVVRLRDEISKLKNELRQVDVNKAPAAAKTLEKQIDQSTRKMRGLVEAAAHAGVEVDNNFRKKIFDASQSVNGLTEKIIAQKAVVKDVEADVRRLGDSYRKALKNNPISASAKLEEYTAARNALNEEKAALFGLTQQQAEARLSVKRLRDEYSLLKEDTEDVAKKTDGFGISLTKAFAVLGGAAMVKSFLSNMVSVRGEFQQIETSMQTILGSKEKADALMAKVKEYAKISPLDLKSVSSATQMMLGFNIEAEKVPRYLQAIGDVSMGDAGRFNSLTLAFSQMSATGRLLGQDLNQMINAGFNPLSVMAEKSGKSIAQLKEEMSKGAISAEMVQQAFIDATSAGGKFYNMSENASKTINGQLSMLQDAMDNVFNELGEKGEGVVLKGIHLTTSLIQNYETVGKVIVGLVSTYSAYRAAVMLASIETGKHTLSEIALTNVRIMARKAQIALNSSMLANPYILLATAVVGLGTAMWALSGKTDSAKRGMDAYNESVRRASEEEANHKQEIEKLLSVAGDERDSTDNRREALRKLEDKYPDIFAKYRTESEMLQNILEINRAISEEYKKRGNQREVDELDSLNSEIKKIENAIKKASESGAGQAIPALVKKRDELITHRNLRERDISKKRREEILSNLTGYSNEELDKEISVRDRLIRKIENSIKLGHKVSGGDLKDGILPGQKSIDELKSEKQALERERNSREKGISYKQDLERAKKDWETAKKELSAIERDKDKFTSKQYEDAKKRVETAEKAYKDLGGKDDKGKTLSYVDSYSHKREIDRYEQSVKDVLIETDLDIRQQQIDLLKDGNEKQIEQIRLNYDKKIAEIQKKERELLNQLQEGERKQWENNNPNFKEKNLQFTPTVKSLTPEQRLQIEKEYSVAYEKQEKDTKDLLDNLLRKYQDYNTQRGEIERQGNDDIKALQAQRTESNAAEIDRAIEVAKQKIKDGIKAINEAEADSTIRDNGFFKKLFADHSQMSFSALQKLISQANSLRDYLVGNGSAEGITFITPRQLEMIEKSPEKLAAIKKELDLILGTRYGRNPFGKIFESFDDGVKKLKNSKGLEDIAGGIGMISGAASDAAGHLSDMLEQMGEDELADSIRGVQELMGAISNIGQGFATGGPVGGVAAMIGETMNIIGKAFAANARHREALRAIMNEAISQQREYNLLLMQQNLEYEKATTIFGTNSYGKAANAVSVAKKAVEDLNKELRGTGKYNESYIERLIKTAYVLAGKYQGSPFELKDQYSGLANIKIKTGHKKTGFLGWGKGKDTYSSILDVYPKLIDANGRFDDQLAKTIINTRTMSDEHRNALQHMIDLAVQAEEAYKSLNDHMTSIFGELGGAITDAIVDAFRNGKDAAKDFMSSVSKMLETLGKQMIYSATIAPIMEKAQRDMMDVMKNQKLTDDQKFEKWTGVLDVLVDDVIAQQDLTKRLLEKYQSMASSKGFDIFTPEPSSQDSTKRGFGTEMTHEDAGELSGRFTALQVAGEEVLTQSVLTNEWLAKIHAKMVAPNIPDIAGQNRSIINSSYQPNIRVDFPAEEFRILSDRIASVERVVTDMRDLQVERSLDTHEIGSGVQIIAKNSPMMLNATEEIKRNTSKL